MEMRDDDLLQLSQSIGGEYYHFDMENLLEVTDDFKIDDTDFDSNYLIGPDVNLANINHMPEFELDDRLGLPSYTLESDQENEKASCFPAKSPWHDSDSGVSEALSSVGSPPDQCLAEKTTGDLFFRRKFTDSVANNEVNSELMEFLFERKEKSFGKMTHMDHIESREDKGQDSHMLTASGRPARKCAKRKFDFSDEDSNSDEQNLMIKKPTTVQSTKTETDVSAHKLANVINVLKIVKPSACTSDTTPEDIMKALDDRSKKNAHQAKINREKKKIYVKQLEDDRESLLKENSKLSSQVEQMTEKKLSLETEVEYLKAVLANASALSGLLKNISNIKEVKLSSSLTSGNRVFENDHSYNLVKANEKRARGDNMKNAGVCLHVSNGEACLEFCAHCSFLAQKTHNYSDTS